MLTETRIGLLVRLVKEGLDNAVELFLGQGLKAADNLLDGRLHSQNQQWVGNLQLLHNIQNILVGHILLERLAEGVGVLARRNHVWLAVGEVLASTSRGLRV